MNMNSLVQVEWGFFVSSAYLNGTALNLQNRV
jgi:hypothetical protein